MPELFSTDRYFRSSQEDRSSPRMRLTIPAMLRQSGGRAFATEVRDLSLGGFSATAIMRMQNGTLCWLKLPGLEALQCEVIWWRENLVGCAFQNLLSPAVHDNIVNRYAKASRLLP